MKKLLLIMAITTLAILSGCGSPETTEKKLSGMLTSTAAAHDWDNINIKGGDVAHTFDLKNESDEPLTITGARTTCMCTTAQFILPDGKKSPAFGMHGQEKWTGTVPPQTSFKMLVTFDPMAHGPDATGPIMRGVQVYSSSHQTALMKRSKHAEFSVAGNVLSEAMFKEKTEHKMGDFTFTEKEHDFGVIKQSGGIQTHNFNFTYNGEKPIEITNVVGSCACTTGSVSKKKLSKGESAILTLQFDPNLHNEPEGKFYKTVSLLTKPKQAENPEVKMWAEIDLDLGPEAYKLKEKHID